MLSWKELQWKLLDVEITLNDPPLSYLEDDPQLPVLTLCSMLFVNSKVLPEVKSLCIEMAGLHKRAKHLLNPFTPKSAIWHSATTAILTNQKLREKGQ